MNRIQRKRTKGWKMPVNSKYVGRPTKWGNPFKLSSDGRILYYNSINRTWCCWSESGGYEVKDVVELYGQWLDGKLHKDCPNLPTPPKIEELKGKDLACFCSLSSPCHVDAILERIGNDKP